MQIIVDKDGIRIDDYVKDVLNISRSKVEKMILDDDLTVNDKKIKKSYLVKKGDIITYQLKEEVNYLEPIKMDLNIVYEDDDVLVVDKPNGLVVHPAVGNKDYTLVNGLINYSKNLSTINGEFRPGIVHRIDAYTTGLLMVAKNDQAHQVLAKQLEEKTITRKYKALVWGVINHDTATIDAPIGRDLKDRKKMSVTSVNSKKAITHFKVLERFEKATLIELKLETGRTHQIRVHMNYIGYPVVNDPVYGRKKLIDDTGQCLHAYLLGFKHPKTNEYLEFKSELPECFTNILDTFKNS